MGGGCEQHETCVCCPTGRCVQVQFGGQRTGAGQRGRRVRGADGRHGRRLRDRRVRVRVEVAQGGGGRAGKVDHIGDGARWRMHPDSIDQQLTDFRFSADDLLSGGWTSSSPGRNRNGFNGSNRIM